MQTVEQEAAAAKPAPELPFPWVPIAWCVGLLILSYFPVWTRLVAQWSNDDDMGHGFFVPAVVAYIVWQERERLLQVALKPNLLGLVVLAWAAVQMSIGILGAELFLQRTSIVITAFGATLLLGGFPLLRALLFPLLLLFFMVPLPAVVMNQLTFPLQLFASAVAEQALSLGGIPVLRDGNVLELASQKLSVVEACSGIRSLLSLTFLSLIYGYFMEPRKPIRWLLFLATIPIAIAANSFRVSMTGFLSEYDPELAKGFFHTLEGWVIFIFALGMLVITHFVLKRLWPGVDSDGPDAPAPVAAV